MWLPHPLARNESARIDYAREYYGPVAPHYTLCADAKSVLRWICYVSTGQVAEVYDSPEKAQARVEMLNRAGLGPLYR